MGALMTKKVPPAPKRRRKAGGHVTDYNPNPVRKRPRTSKSWRDARYITNLCQQGRSATMVDLTQAGRDQQKQINKNLPPPRWQSKWEVDMRPDPNDISAAVKSKTTLKPWKSMPIPTTAESTDKSTAANSRNTSRRGRRRRPQDRRSGLASARSNMTAVEETEKFERVSVSSIQMDGFSMLYKTDARTDSVFDMTLRLWQVEPKKRGLKWFLADTHHTKEQHPSEIVQRSVKPYTSIVKTISHKPIQPTIVEED